MPLDNGSFVCFFISARQLVVQISALLVFLTTASVLSKSVSSSCSSYLLPLPFNIFHLKPFFPIGEHNGHESSISGGMLGPPHSCVKKCAMHACYTLCGSVCFRFASNCVKYVYLVLKYVEAHVCIPCGMCVLFMEVCIQGAACKSGLLALIWPSMPTRARSAHPIFMTKPLYEFATSILKQFLIHSVSSG